MTTLESKQLKFPGATTGTIVGDSLYVIGGSDDPYGHLDWVKIVSVADFDDAQDGTPVPTPRGNLAVESVEDKIFAVAGLLASGNENGQQNTPCAVVEVLDTATGSWSQCAPLPAQRVKPGLTSIGTTLYALGGREDEIDANTIFAYSMLKKSWEEVGRLPYGARHGSACSADGVVYYSGGFTGLSKTFHDELIAFHPWNGEVKQLASLPVPRTAHSLVAVGKQLYVLGGVDMEKKPTSTVFCYDIESNHWTECKPLSSERAMFACGVSGTDILVAGGWTRLHKEANSSAERYSVG